ncbi:hypothetical protein PENSPDRAFT_658603 [Peniophora sp. CONT]|nr:hypothetical protein PENSPDRAFT_658603 [Peniophora sp. CONT]
MSASTSTSKQPILWTNPRNPKERVTIYRAPPHEDGRPRVICDLCSFPCVVSGTGTSTQHLSNFTIHRGSANCLKRASTIKKPGGGKSKGKITSHFARTPSSASSRASSEAVSEILDEGETDGGSVPGTVSSSSPREKPMEIDLTSPSPEPEPVVITAKAKGKGKAGPTFRVKKDELKIIEYNATTKGKAQVQATTSLSGATSDEMEVLPPKHKKVKATTYGATTTSYEMAASTSSASTRTNTPLTTLVIPNAPTTNNTSTSTLPTATLPTCTTCRHPNTTPQYKMCEPCRIYYRDRSRIKAERVKASAALKLAEAGGDMKEIERAKEESERMRGKGAKRDYSGAVGGKEGKKRKRDVEPVLEERMIELVFDPDECGTAAQAYSILLSELNPPPVKPPRAPLPQPKLNIRLTWAVVADGSISHRSRIEGVVRELREIGLQFGSVGKTQEPGSRYARYNTITEKYRCKCSVSTTSTSTSSSAQFKPAPGKPLARKQSDLSTFFSKPQPKNKGAIRMEEEEEDVLMLVPPELVNGGAGGQEEKCGGNVYVSSEWDVKSHPCGVRGQRVVVWVVHESDPIQ